MQNRRPTGPEWRQIAWCLVLIAGMLGAYAVIRPAISSGSVPTVISDQARTAAPPLPHIS